MQFAKRIENLKPSPTLALNARAKKMQAEGVSVVNFTCGEPDFDTPLHISEAGIAAIKSGFTRYTPVGGIPELKDSIVRALKREQGLEYQPAEVVVTPGAKYALFIAMQAILNAGDEVIIGAPYWVSYPDQVMLCEAVPVIVATSESNNFKLTVVQIKQAITKKTRLLILNSPSNPTGMAYSEAELKDIAAVCRDAGICVLSDEIYDGIVFDGFKCRSIATFDGMKDLTIVINGTSKKFAMTGWRMGFAAGPRQLITKMTDIQGQAVTNVSSITQKAAIAAYDGPQAPVEKMVAAFRERRDYMVGRLNEMGLACARPNGAFYAFPNVTPFSSNSQDFSEYLLDTAHVATVPGSSFGLEGYIRLSFATSMKAIEEGLNRIQKAI
jgi:aspartate aminotransferase